MSSQVDRKKQDTQVHPNFAWDLQHPEWRPPLWSDLSSLTLISSSTSCPPIIPSGWLCLTNKVVQGQQSRYYNVLYQFPRTAMSKYHTLHGLKKTEIYHLIVLKARSMKSRCRQGHVNSETCKGILCLSSFCCLLKTLSIPWLVDASLHPCLTRPSPCVPLSLCFSSLLVRTELPFY